MQKKADVQQQYSARWKEFSLERASFSSGEGDANVPYEATEGDTNVPSEASEGYSDVSSQASEEKFTWI